jgi:GAF domain-containing protein
MTVTINDDTQQKSGARDFERPRAEIVRLLESTPLKTSQLSSVLEAAGQVIPGCAITLYLLNRDREVLQEIVSHGHTVNVFEQLHFGGGTGLAGWVMRQRRPLFLRGRSPENDGVRDHHDTLLFIPLRNGQEPLGLLAASHIEIDGLDDDCRTFLRETANQMAQALVRRVEHGRSAVGANDTPAEDPLPSAVAGRGCLTTAAELARQAVDEINQTLSAIIGNVRMIELEAPHLPPAAAGHLQAIIGEARQISLISHKLTRLDRLLTGGEGKDEVHSDETILGSMGDISC